MISHEIQRSVAFYDVDSMGVMWHGNYVKLFEEARCALLSLINYDYVDMQKSGFAWPVVTLNVKYIRPVVFNQQIKIRAEILEYEHRLKIKYVIFDAQTNEKINVAETVQIAIDMSTHKTLFVSPQELFDKIKKYEETHNA